MTRGFYWILFFCVIVLAAEGCKNNDNVFPKVQVTALNIVNASADTLNFYLNGTRQNNSSSIFPDGQSYYLIINAGQQNFQFKKAGDFNILFSYPANLTDSTNNSLYITGGSASGSFLSKDLLDTTNFYKDTVFRLRFVNASPDAGSLDVTVDSATISNSAFKSISPYVLYGSGPKKVKVFKSGSGSASIDTTIIFQPGHIYTVYSKGLLNGKGAAVFDVGVALNY